MRGENLPLIFGLKLRQLREERGLGLKEVAALSGISPSYLNEIEKGKKYPKASKILQLAQALHVPYDEMVSLKLGTALHPLESFLESPIIQALPLQMFGLTPRDILDLIQRAPHELSALIHALVEIAASYDMQVEHFFYAMLRSYQETHDNYFEEIERAAETFARAHDLDPPLSLERLRRVLEAEFGVQVDTERLTRYPELSGFRSVWVEGPPERLLINPRLREQQQAFQIGREIGYRDLHLRARGIASSRAEVHSFEQVLNDFKASYYAGALLTGQETLVQDLARFLALPRWDGQGFLGMMNRYRVTPEMFLYRLTQLIPKRFGLKGLHFVRISHEAAGGPFRLNKQFNLAGHPFPAAGLGWSEHYCRRWMAVALLGRLEPPEGPGRMEAPIIAAQRAHFLNNKADYFLVTLARPLALTPGTNTSVTLGFLLDEAFQAAVAFWDDPAVPRTDVNESCERCGLSEADCTVRAAPPHVYRQRQALERRNRQLQRLLAEAGGA